MSRHFRPHRSLRSEIAALALVAAVPSALIAIFPLAALRPLPSAPACAAEASCAFVTLTHDEERQALMAARAAWQTDRDAARSRRIDLFADALPSERPRAVLDILSQTRADSGTLEPYRPDMLPPSHAAPPPATIVPQPDAETPTPTFPREELLKMAEDRWDFGHNN